MDNTTQATPSWGSGYRPRPARPNQLIEIRSRYGIMQQELQREGQFSLNTITGIEKHGIYPKSYTRYKLIIALNSLIAEKGFTEEVTEADVWPEVVDEEQAA